MIIVISPAKKLDESPAPKGTAHTRPDYLPQSQDLIDILQDYSSVELSRLMKLSDNLAELNRERYADWHPDYDEEEAKQALLMMKGDVYRGIDAETLSKTDLKYAQNHLRILSGLYGLLRPMDLILPYRLEMGTRLPSSKGKNLYEFWDDAITNGINKVLTKQKTPTLVNLASIEYFKSVKTEKIDGPIIDVNFKEKKNGAYKIIGVHAKYARGLMTRFVIQNQIDEPNGMKDFSQENYTYNENLSGDYEMVFTRG